MRAAESAVAYERSKPPTLAFNADVVGLADRLATARQAWLRRQYPDLVSAHDSSDDDAA
jgi:hypothetical protein